MESYTYSNTICPKCHSDTVEWWNVTTGNSSATKLKCLHCGHVFDPPTIQLPEKKSKYPIITLCGSTRYRDIFMYMQKELTLAGYIVISVGCFGHYETEQEAERITANKDMLDDMHKRKIDMAESIYVINPGGYIGSSTASEINYATEHHKNIYYLVPPQSEGENRNGTYIN